MNHSQSCSAIYQSHRSATLSSGFSLNYYDYLTADISAASPLVCCPYKLQICTCGMPLMHLNSTWPNVKFQKLTRPAVALLACYVTSNRLGTCILYLSVLQAAHTQTQTVIRQASSGSRANRSTHTDMSDVML